MQTTLNQLVNLSTIQIEGIDKKDYPDFVDAFISYAEFRDGTPLTESQLETLTELYYNDGMMFDMIVGELFL